MFQSHLQFQTITLILSSLHPWLLQLLTNAQKIGFVRFDLHYLFGCRLINQIPNRLSVHLTVVKKSLYYIFYYFFKEIQVVVIF